MFQSLGAMFKSSVAWVLNKYLGKYVQDLDTENLNVGIFNGEVQLHDLKLKPEALVRLIVYSLNTYICVPYIFKTYTVQKQNKITSIFTPFTLKTI